MRITPRLTQAPPIVTRPASFDRTCAAQLLPAAPAFARRPHRPGANMHRVAGAPVDPRSARKHRNRLPGCTREAAHSAPPRTGSAFPPRFAPHCTDHLRCVSRPHERHRPAATAPWCSALGRVARNGHAAERPVTKPRRAPPRLVHFPSLISLAVYDQNRTSCAFRPPPNCGSPPEMGIHSRRIAAARRGRDHLCPATCVGAKPSLGTRLAMAESAPRERTHVDTTTSLPHTHRGLKHRNDWPEH